MPEDVWDEYGKKVREEAAKKKKQEEGGSTVALSKPSPKPSAEPPGRPVEPKIPPGTPMGTRAKLMAPYYKALEEWRKKTNQAQAGAIK